MAETLTSTGVLDTAQEFVRLSLAGMGGVSIQVQGTFSGTITFEGTVQGQAFTAFLVTPIGSTTAVTSTTSTGIWTGSAVGLTSIQARASSWSSGAATVLIRAAVAAPGGAGGGGGGGGAVTIADGADVAEGATTDAKVTGDNDGTVSAKLRGISYFLALVIDTLNSWVKVSIQNATLAVTQSGSWVLSAGSALIGKVSIDQTTPGTTNAVSATNFPTTVDTNSGNKSASTLRVVVATDQPALTNALAVAGDVANDGVDSGNPVKIGGKAVTAAPTAVAAADRVNALFDVWGRLYTRNGAQAPVASTFTQVHIPSTNVQATKTQSSAGSGKRNVCTGFTVTLCAGASAPTAAAPITVAVVDGASGGTTYLWRSYINIPAVAGAQISIVRTGLWLVGSQATDMTVEFSAAGGTNTYESVAFNGVIVEE